MPFLNKIIIVFTLTIFSFKAFGQNCSCISGTKDKKKGIETIGGVTNSKDYYSLLIQKIMSVSDTSIAPKYVMTLNAASRVLLSDSVIKTRGIFELKLLDNSSITLDSVSYFNNPLGYCCSLGFQCEVTEEIIKILSQNPIYKLTVKDILSTEFAPKKQKEQQTIYSCLLNRKPQYHIIE